MEPKLYAQEYEEAAIDLIIFMSEQNAPNYAFYAGITTDPTQRLFDEHQLPHNQPHRVVRCENHQEARELEKQLHKSGCDGGPGGEDNSSEYVYVYLTSPQTRQ